MKILAAAACVALGLTCISIRAEDKKPAIKEGDKAPDFKLKASDGKEYALKDFAGKKAVVIAWFPKAFTGGCTAECKSMRESGEEIRKFDVAYFTASVDDAETNKKFAESLGLDFPILSDPDKKAAAAYGVLNDKGMANRQTIFIDKEGIIRFIDKKVNTKDHGKDIAKKLDELKVPKKK